MICWIMSLIVLLETDSPLATVNPEVKKLEGKYTMWRANVFVGDSTTNGRLVDTYGLGNRVHCKRAQLGNSFGKEASLAI